MDFLKIFPVPEHPDDKWINSQDTVNYFTSIDSLFVKNILPIYFENISYGLSDNDWLKADSILHFIRDYQIKFGANIELLDNEKLSALQHAQQNKQSDIVKMIESGTFSDVTDILQQMEILKMKYCF